MNSRHGERSKVGSCVPGDVVTVYGVVRCMPTSGGIGGGGERQAPNKSLYILYLEVKAEGLEAFHIA